MDSRCSDIMNRNVKEIPSRVLRVIHQRKKNSPNLVQLLGSLLFTFILRKQPVRVRVCLASSLLLPVCYNGAELPNARHIPAALRMVPPYVQTAKTSNDNIDFHTHPVCKEIIGLNHQD